MTFEQFSEKTSALIQMHPQQGDLIAIAYDDAYYMEDNDPNLELLWQWCLQMCAENVILESITI